jgi:hypothetical protein
VATFRVLRPQSADVEVSTPQASIRPKNEGVYRLAVGDDGQSEITVRAGEVEVFTPRGAETLYPGRTMQMRGTVSEPEFQVVAANGEDEWDGWNRERDRVLMRSVSARYVSPDIYGAEDLDDHGRWVSDPTYGHVWAPQVAPGWAPYQAGRWVWEDYYGWTWVSADPWGWAPYHYGRWFNSPAFGWCWYPGGIGFGVRHYWSPALVGFVGFGGGFGVGFGFGHVGWIPLAPFERFHPWYGRGGYGGGFGGRTVVNNVNIYNSYRNARVTNAVTHIDRAGFSSGGFGRPYTGNLQQASVLRGQLPFTPSRSSMQLSNRSVNPASFSRASNNTQFFSSRQAGQVSRSGFGQGSAGAGSQSSQGSWRRFGQPSTGGAGINAGSTNNSTSRGNWGRFGDPSTRTAPAQQQNRSAFSSGSNGGNWQRFNSSPTQQRPSSGNFGAPSGNSGYRSSPQSMRMNPPMVRERSAPAAPAYNGGFQRNSGNFSRPSAPQVQQRYSAPPMRQQSAPAPHYSGGGGGYRGGSAPSSHSSGGGGGGHQSSGGSHRR